MTTNKYESLKSFAMPIEGELLPLTEVPDQVFSSGMMGQGFGIRPIGDTVFAPFDGKVVSVFPTKHAIGLESDTGLEVLIHIGVDTVKLNGQGFELFIESEQKIKRGDAMLKLDLAYIEANAPSSITPVIFMNATDAQLKLLKTGVQPQGTTSIIDLQ